MNTLLHLQPKIGALLHYIYQTDHTYDVYIFEFFFSKYFNQLPIQNLNSKRCYYYIVIKTFFTSLFSLF